MQKIIILIATIIFLLSCDKENEDKNYHYQIKELDNFAYMSDKKQNRYIDSLFKRIKLLESNSSWLNKRILEDEELRDLQYDMIINSLKINHLLYPKELKYNGKKY